MYLENLNKPQYEAVIHEGSPLLILAGAGSGKTNVITNKIAYLIDQKGVDPSSILAVTFTNKAAKEMQERVSAILAKHTNTVLHESPMIRTFHSFGAWALRRNGSSVGLDPNYTIHDDEDMLTLIHSAVKDAKTKRDLKPYVNMISRAKDYCLSYNDDLSGISHDPHFPDVYKEYQQKLDSTGGADFGDLIMKTWMLLRDNSVIRERLMQKFKIILVDEYQDSNVAQLELLKQLAGNGENLTVVGDDDQSIYRFRGAEVNNILTFPNVFKKTKIIKLEQNYRSTPNILDIASAVVSNNQGRFGKKLWTEKTVKSKSTIAILETEEEEARFCMEIVAADGNFSNTAILYRTNAQSRAFESVFLKFKIPYKIVGALRFLEREEVKDILAFVSLFINPKNEASFLRIINKLARGIGKASIEKIIKAAAKVNGDLLKACGVVKKELSGKAAIGALDFFQIMETLKEYFDGCSQKESKKEQDLSEFIKRCAHTTGLVEYYREIDKAGDTQKLLNIEELVNHAASFPFSFEGLIAFIENTELDRTAAESGASSGELSPAVTLITMHNTKGLEFDRVIITGLEKGLFPSFGNMESNEDIEEERRIFYVSITRARKELYMTFCRSRRIWGKINYFSPSPFLSEIPEDLVIMKGFNNKTAEAMDCATDGCEESRTSPAGGWRSVQGELKEGDIVYSKKYGIGQIIKKWINKNEPGVDVMFESGSAAKFLLNYSDLKKIRNNYY